MGNEASLEGGEGPPSGLPEGLAPDGKGGFVRVADGTPIRLEELGEEERTQLAAAMSRAQGRQPGGAAAARRQGCFFFNQHYYYYLFFWMHLKYLTQMRRWAARERGCGCVKPRFGEASEMLQGGSRPFFNPPDRTKTCIHPLTAQCDGSALTFSDLHDKKGRKEGKKEIMCVARNAALMSPWHVRLISCVCLPVTPPCFVFLSGLVCVISPDWRIV